MVGSGRVSGGSLGAVLLVGVLFFLFLGIISCQTRQMATITVPSTGSFELLKPLEKQRRAGHRHFNLNYVSKRRVPNGPDPIHNSLVSMEEANGVSDSSKLLSQQQQQQKYTKR